MRHTLGFVTTLSLTHCPILLNIHNMPVSQDAGLERKDYLTYNDFKLMMKEYKGDFVAIGLDCKGAKQNFLDTSTNVARMTSFHIDQLPSEDSKSWTRKQWDAVSTFLEENRQNIFYLFVFYVVTIALFVERFIREHSIELVKRQKSKSTRSIKIIPFKHLRVAWQALPLVLVPTPNFSLPVFPAQITLSWRNTRI